MLSPFAQKNLDFLPALTRCVRRQERTGHRVNLTQELTKPQRPSLEQHGEGRACQGRDCEDRRGADHPTDEHLHILPPQASMLRARTKRSFAYCNIPSCRLGGARSHHAVECKFYMVGVPGAAQAEGGVAERTGAVQE